jgi:uncharacterized membrane protein
MADVAALVHRGVLGAAGSVIALFAYQRWHGLSHDVLRDAFIMACALLITLVPFSFTFEKFHELFFPQGNWQFPTDSWLISHFSEQFFLGAAIAWFGAAALSLWWLQRVNAMRQTTRAQKSLHRLDRARRR